MNGSNIKINASQDNMHCGNSERIYFLDGIRGWGAVTVLLFHFWVLGFPISEKMSILLKKLFFFNGGIAVYIFFIASGFSLTISYFNKQNSLILKRILLGRYFRLIIPVGAISFICYLAFFVGLVPALDLRPAAYKNFLVQLPSFFDFIRFHLFQVMFHNDTSQSLIPPLWTMQIEFLGSVLLIMALLIADGRNYKLLYLFVVGCASLLLNIHFCLFFIGAILSWIYTKLPHVDWPRLGYLVFCLALVSSWFFNYFDSWLIFSFIFHIVCLLCFFLSAMYCKPVQSFLSNRLSRYLGKISFPLYLIHSVVLWTLGLSLVGVINNGLICCLGMVVSLILAHYLTFVDLLGIKVSRKVGAFVDELPTRKKVILDMRGS